MGKRGFSRPAKELRMSSSSMRSARAPNGAKTSATSREARSNQNVVYMIDLQTMQKFTFPTGTRRRRHLRGRTQRCRPNDAPIPRTGIYPVVSPAAKHMKTRFGGRQRPYFEIKRWISFGPDGTAALPPATPPSCRGWHWLRNKAPTVRPRLISTARPGQVRSGAERRSCRRGAHAPRRAERRYP